MSTDCLLTTGKEFCNPETNQCSDNIDSCTGTSDYCPGDGVWPNLRNCSRYFHCEDNTVSSHECEFGTIFNYKSGRCEDDAPCSTYTHLTGCQTKVLAAHHNPNWFVFCAIWPNPILAQCPAKSYSFSEETGNCEYRCGRNNMWRNGKYADELDSAVYHNCYKKGSKWITKTERCREGSVFREALQICV